MVSGLTSFLSRALKPILKPVARWVLSSERKRPTWQYEAPIIAIILCVVAFFGSPVPWANPTDPTIWKHFFINWLSVVAVMGSFLHAQVGTHMSEAMEVAENPAVHCFTWSGRYWIVKEILWAIVFFLSGAFPAIIGSGLFILYPAWREILMVERKKMRDLK